MKNILNNLFLPLIYYFCFAVYALIFEFFGFGLTAGVITFYLLFIFMFILAGCFVPIKKLRFGLILLEAQLILCPLLFHLTEIKLNGFASLGNIMVSTLHPMQELLFGYDYSFAKRLPDYIISMLLPVLCILLGNLLSKKFKFNHKQRLYL